MRGGQKIHAWDENVSSFFLFLFLRSKHSKQVYNRFCTCPGEFSTKNPWAYTNEGRNSQGFITTPCSSIRETEPVYTKVYTKIRLTVVSRKAFSTIARFSTLTGSKPTSKARTKSNGRDTIQETTACRSIDLVRRKQKRKTPVESLLFKS